MRCWHEKRSLKRGISRKFTSFTALTTPIYQVLMQIKDEGALTFPGKLKGDPNKRSRDKCCHFHRDYGHDTADCYDLKQQIKTFIRQGKLQRFVSKEKADPPQEQALRWKNKRLRLPIGDIRMIVRGITATGSSKKAGKTYFRIVQNIQLMGSVPKMVRVDNPIIRFSEDDARRFHHPHDDALVVSIRVGDYNTHRVLVDNGSSANILYNPASQQMRIDKERLVLMNAPFIGFGGTKDVTFLVVDYLFAYNAILGWSTLN